MCSTPDSDARKAETDDRVPHDCSAPKNDPPQSDQAEQWGLGRPGSEEARLGTSKARHGHGSAGYFVKRAGL